MTLTSILLLTACSRAEPAPEVVPPAPAPAVQEDPLEPARLAVAERLGVPPTAVAVDEVARGKVPGVVVFVGFKVFDDGARARATPGVLIDGRAELDLDAARRAVAKAWGYGPERPVDAATVASVYAHLQATDEAVNPLTKQRHIDRVHSRWRDQVFLPREVEVDGAPAVEFWVQSAEPPLWMNTVVFGADGAVTMGSKEP